LGKQIVGNNSGLCVTSKSNFLLCIVDAIMYFSNNKTETFNQLKFCK